jgi:hypothetical protein
MRKSVDGSSCSTSDRVHGVRSSSRMSTSATFGDDGGGGSDGEGGGDGDDDGGGGEGSGGRGGSGGDVMAEPNTWIRAIFRVRQPGRSIVTWLPTAYSPHSTTKYSSLEGARWTLPQRMPLAPPS